MMAEQKRAHNIAEAVMQPSALAMTRFVLGDKHEESPKAISLYNNTRKEKNCSNVIV